MQIVEPSNQFSVAVRVVACDKSEHVNLMVNDNDVKKPAPHEQLNSKPANSSSRRVLRVSQTLQHCARD